MRHDGEILAQMLADAGISKGAFAAKMGVQRGTPRRWLEMREIPEKRLREAAKALRVELGDYFPHLVLKGRATTPPPLVAPPATVADVPSPGYGFGLPQELARCQSEKADWQSRCFEAMEKYAKLLEDHNKLLHERLQSTAFTRPPGKASASGAPSAQRAAY